MRRSWPSKLYCIVWSTLGFTMLLGGIVSENVVRMVVGAVIVFTAVSAYLISYVERNHRAAKAVQIATTFLAMLIIVYGYILTKALILRILTLFIIGMLFVAFVLSYLLPKIRAKSE